MPVDAALSKGYHTVWWLALWWPIEVFSLISVPVIHFAVKTVDYLGPISKAN